MWYLVKASDLKLTDRFMKYMPSNLDIQPFKQSIEKMIWYGVNDFYCPQYFPSNAKNGGLCFESDVSQRVTGRNAKWWEWSSRRIEPYYTRLGTELESLACQAVLIKEFVEAGWKAEDAWTSVYKCSFPVHVQKDFELSRILAEQNGLSKIVANSNGDGFLILLSSSSYSIAPYKRISAYGWIVREINY